jgi:LytS/YehU family sensor histidine kinase
MDYLIDYYPLQTALAYSFFEILLYCIEVYINIYILIPRLLQRKKHLSYFGSILILLTCVFWIYFFTNLSGVLLSENTGRAVISFAINHLLFLFISFLYWYFTMYEKEKQKKIALENEKLKIELEALKSQVSPHFLFNSLNGIYSLILIDSMKAAAMVDDLSKILRYFIYECTNTFVLLEKEVLAIKHYIGLQKTRLQERGEAITLDITIEDLALLIPPLIFMTIIENAFKHGNIADDEKGFIQIHLFKDTTHVHFQVRNSFNKHEYTAGIGLQNIRNQLKVLYEDKVELTTEVNLDTYFVKLKLPIVAN